MIKKLVKHIPNPQEITEEDKDFSNLDYDGIEFHLSFHICINVFGYEDGLVFSIYV